jgi:hypothetical protein
MAGDKEGQEVRKGEVDNWGGWWVEGAATTSYGNRCRADVVAWGFLSVEEEDQDNGPSWASNLHLLFGQQN